MSETETKRGRGRPRRSDADAAILDAASAILRESGFAAFNVDLVAARSGVAKTTIYRRWPAKEDVVAAVLDAAITPDGKTVERILGEIAAAAKHLGAGDTQSLAVLVPFVASRRSRIIAAGHRTGAADALVGALLFRFATGGTIDDEYVGEIVKSVAGGEV